MPIETPWLPGRIRAALDLLQVHYITDEDEDIVFEVSRRKGKDLHFVIFHRSAMEGFFSLESYCFVRYRKEETLSALMFCNTWNKDKRPPRAYLEEADADGDHLILLDHHMILTDAADTELIARNLDFVIRGCINFWDSADKEL